MAIGPVDAATGGATWLWPVAVAATALCFGASGIRKLVEPSVTAEAMKNYRLLAHPVLATARLLAGYEILLALGVIVGWFNDTVGLFVAAAGLVTVVEFSSLIATELVAKSRFECGCFGGRGTVGKPALARNAAIGIVFLLIGVRSAAGLSVNDRPTVALALVVSCGLVALGVLSMGSHKLLQRSMNGE